MVFSSCGEGFFAILALLGRGAGVRSARAAQVSGSLCGRQGLAMEERAQLFNRQERFGGDAEARAVFLAGVFPPFPPFAIFAPEPAPDLILGVVLAEHGDIGPMIP